MRKPPVREAMNKLIAGIAVLAWLAAPALAQPYDPYTTGKHDAVQHGDPPHPPGALPPGAPPVPTQSSPGNGPGLPGNDRPGDNDNRPDGTRNERPSLNGDTPDLQSAQPNQPSKSN